MALFEPKSRRRLVIDQELDDNRVALGKARSQLAGALADIARLEHERDGLLDRLHAEASGR